MMVGTVFTTCVTAPPEFIGGSAAACPTLAGFKWTDAANATPSSISFTVDASWSCSSAAGARNVLLNGTVAGTIQSTSAACACLPGTIVRGTSLTSLASFVRGGVNTITITAGANGSGTTGCEAIQSNPAWTNDYGFINLTY
jgi:hypothetical protein